MLKWRGIGRAAGQGRTIRRGGMNRLQLSQNSSSAFASRTTLQQYASFTLRLVWMLVEMTYVVFGQQARTELEIIIQVEGPSSLEARTEDRDHGCLRQFLHTPHPPKLTMGVLRRRKPRRSSRSTAMMVVRRRHRGLVVLRSVIVSRHDDGDVTGTG